MYETESDVAALQRLLDESNAGAGTHLARIITAERRLSAQEVVAWLTGMRLLVLATVTADGRPLVGPVDGISYRGPSTSAPPPIRSGSATCAGARRSAPPTFPARSWR